MTLPFRSALRELFLVNRNESVCANATECIGLTIQDFACVARGVDAEWGPMLDRVRRGKVSHRFAERMLAFAAAAYVRDDAARNALLPTDHWQTSLCAFDRYQAIVSESVPSSTAHRRVLVVAFRGTELPDAVDFSVINALLTNSVIDAATEMLQDWLNNFSGAAQTVDLQGGGFAHGEFHRGVVGLFNDGGVGARIAQFVAAHGDAATIVFTGHSQGAGLATVAAAVALLTPSAITIEDATWTSKLRSLVLFANPRVLDGSAQRRLQLALRIRSVSAVSYMNYRDPVPHLPPERPSDVPWAASFVPVRDFDFGPGETWLLNYDEGRQASSFPLPPGQEGDYHVRSQFILSMVTRLGLYHGLGGTTSLLRRRRSGYIDAIKELALMKA